MEYELLFSSQATRPSAGTVILPSGSLEQHGTEAPLGCDAIIARHLCLKAGSLTGVPVLPSLPYGDSRCHQAFPGTFSLTTETLTSLYAEILQAASRNGFRRCLIISGHGGNRTAAEEACSRDYGAMKPAYLGYWQLPGADELEQRLFTRSGDHVTAAEVSMVWHLLGKRPPGLFTGTYPPWESGANDPGEFRRLYPDGGVGGDMSGVSVEKGAELFGFLVRSLCAVLDESIE